VSVLINGRFLTHSVTGVERYALELVKAIDTLRLADDASVRGLDFVVVTPQKIQTSLSLSTIPIKAIGRLSGHAWEQFELATYRSDDLLLNPCNTGPLFRTRQIVTIHDAAVFARPEGFSRAFKTWYRVLLPRLSKNSKAVITISNFSKRELMHFCQIHESKLYVTYQSGEQVLRHSPDYTILDKHRLKDKPFIFAVSSLHPNKNFLALAKAIGLIQDRDFEVVIAGGTNPTVFQSQSSLPSDVRYLGYVTEGELRALYTKAQAYVSPTLYEGFGLTPLEAMTCGCPVIVSNVASLPEVCGDAALYFDPQRPDDIAATIQNFMADAALRRELVPKSLERAQQFSWRKCALDTLQVIRQFA
jgi:glycosyltransferase involved in cell wall biosynthesis